MNASEAKELTMKSVPKIINQIIDKLNLKIVNSASSGYYSTSIQLNSQFPSLLKITNQIIEHFENQGYEVSIEDLDNTVKIQVSWLYA